MAGVGGLRGLGAVVGARITVRAAAGRAGARLAPEGVWLGRGERGDTLEVFL